MFFKISLISLLLDLIKHSGSISQVWSMAVLIAFTEMILCKWLLGIYYLFCDWICRSFDFIQLITYSDGFNAGEYGAIVNNRKSYFKTNFSTSEAMWTDALSTTKINLFPEIPCFASLILHTLLIKWIMQLLVEVPAILTTQYKYNFETATINVILIGSSWTLAKPLIPLQHHP